MPHETCTRTIDMTFRMYTSVIKGVWLFAGIEICVFGLVLGWATCKQPAGNLQATYGQREGNLRLNLRATSVRAICS